LNLNPGPGGTYSNIGFRVSRWYIDKVIAFILNNLEYSRKLWSIDGFGDTGDYYRNEPMR
jgi:hypothetical protein